MSTVSGSLSTPGQTLVCQMDGYLACSFSLTGTFADADVWFEGSLDQSNWRRVFVTRSANTAPFEWNTGPISSPPNFLYYVWNMQWPYVRCRLDSITSGAIDIVIYAQGLTPAASSGGTDTVEAVDIHSTNAATLSLTTSAAQTSVVGADGIYDLLSDVDCFIRIDPSSAASVTTSNGYKLLAGNCVSFRLSSADKIGGIVATGTGTLRYQRAHA